MLTRNLFILGAQKCGTSSLAIALDGAFSEIELSTPKEPMIFSLGDFETHRTPFCDLQKPFFVDNEEKRRMHEACFHTDASVRLDASTSYAISPLACEAIKACFPDAKAILLLRDPVERMVSAYWHYVRTGLIAHGFDRAIELGPLHLVNCGFYLKHIRDVSRILGRENLLVVSDRHLYDEPAAFLERFESFTGLSHCNDFTLGRDNIGKYPRMAGFQLFANYFRQKSKKNFYHRAKADSRLKTYGLLGGAAELLTRFNICKDERPRLRSLLVERLVTMYRVENEGIDEYFDLGNPAHWYGDYSRYFEAVS